MGHIQINYGDKEQFIYIHEDNPLFVGSNPDASYSAVIKDAGLEDTHAKIENIDNRVFITDLSKNSKVTLNNQSIAKNIPTPLEPGTSIQLGAENVLILIPNINYQEVLPEAAPKLIDLSSLLDGKQSIKVGTDSTNDIIIQDSIVASFHAEIYKKQDEVYIRDLGSTNGTFIGGEKIKGERKLDPEEVCYVGLTAITLGKQVTDFKPDVAITALNISKVFGKGNVGLQPMNLSINTGEFVALMGPSGCGKSTLLKALTGDNPATGGKVFLFGLDLIEHFKLLKKKIGYVPQEDIIHRDLTVYETLYFAAKLRLDQSTPEAEIKERINEVLTALNINSDKIIKTRVKSLSGGQRKRISIAVELLNKPSILFLDEPTSPLDPETIEEFLKCIQALCKKGTTVIMVTHKPEDLNFADRLIFMGSSGYHVYDGSKEKILPYFQKSHIVQIYTLLSQKEKSQDWYQQWYSLSELPRMEGGNQLQVDRDVNVFYQLKWLLKRNIAIKMGNPANLRLQFLQPIIISLLMILVFNNLVKDNLPTPGVIFMMNIATIWFGVSNAAREIVDELSIYKRERMFNLKIGPYLCSKLTLLGAMGIVQTLVLTLIIKMNYQSQMVMFGNTWLFLWLIFMSGVILGLMISASAKTTESVMTILPIALLPQNILAGIVAPIDDKFTEILSFLTLGRWGTEGLARIQDKFDSGIFKQHVLDRSLYYENSFKAFNSFQANILVILTMNVIIMALTIYQLHKKDSIPS